MFTSQLKRGERASLRGPLSHQGSGRLWPLTLATSALLTLCALCALGLTSLSAQPLPDELELEELGEGSEAPPSSLKGPEEGQAQAAQAAQKDQPAQQSSDSKSQVKVEKIPEQVKAQPKRGADVYKQQIAQIEAQVNELKEEVFRSRARIDTLKETVLAIGLTGSEAKVTFRNEMGANFKLERVLYMIDGVPYSFDENKTPDLNSLTERTIYDGLLSQENHTIQVELVYRGNGFGVFSYLQAYRFTLNNVYTFRPEEGKRTLIKVIGYEKGGIQLELMERPAIRFDVSEEDLDQKKRPDGK